MGHAAVMLCILGRLEVRVLKGLHSSVRYTHPLYVGFVIAIIRRLLILEFPFFLMLTVVVYLADLAGSVFSGGDAFGLLLGGVVGPGVLVVRGSLVIS